MDGSGGRRLEKVDGYKRFEDMDGLEVEDVECGWSWRTLGLQLNLVITQY